LAKIGAIALIWNTIETRIEFLTCITFAHQSFSVKIGMELVRSIKTLDRRMELLTQYSEDNSLLSTKAKMCIKTAFDSVKEYRTYRNGIIHSYVYDYEK